jgi:hypothetical protein
VKMTVPLKVLPAVMRNVPANGDGNSSKGWFTKRRVNHCQVNLNALVSLGSGSIAVTRYTTVPTGAFSVTLKLAFDVIVAALSRSITWIVPHTISHVILSSRVEAHQQYTHTCSDVPLRGSHDTSRVPACIVIGQLDCCDDVNGPRGIQNYRSHIDETKVGV